MPEGAFRPRLMALVALLSSQYRLSKRMVQPLLSDVLGVAVALGSISTLEGRMSTALAGVMEQASEYVRDEPSWRRGASEGVAVGGVTTWVTGFQIATSRGSSVARDMLGEDWVGYLVTNSEALLS